MFRPISVITSSNISTMYINGTIVNWQHIWKQIVCQILSFIVRVLFVLVYAYMCVKLMPLTIVSYKIHQTQCKVYIAYVNDVIHTYTHSHDMLVCHVYVYAQISSQRRHSIFYSIVRILPTLLFPSSTNRLPLEN